MSETLLPRGVLAFVRGAEREVSPDFHVRRAIPSPRCRAIGPFVFFDEMGPGGGFTVRPHPHIGLATVSYLFEGAIRHRDSLASDLMIEPGAVNWMVAGCGIVHSEVADVRTHGIQLWVALPDSHEEVEPSFTHYAADVFPEFASEGSVSRVLLGEAYGLRSPATVFSPMAYAELRVSGRLPLPADHSERALYTVDEGLEVSGEIVPAKTLVIFEAGADVAVSGRGRAMWLAGESVGARYLSWNFVSSSKERLERAREDWTAGRFDAMEGDDDRIPFPG